MNGWWNSYSGPRLNKLEQVFVCDNFTLIYRYFAIIKLIRKHLLLSLLMFSSICVWSVDRIQYKYTTTTLSSYSFNLIFQLKITKKIFARNMKKLSFKMFFVVAMLIFSLILNVQGCTEDGDPVSIPFILVNYPTEN